jgi:hypothetical protein
MEWMKQINVLWVITDEKVRGLLKHRSLWTLSEQVACIQSLVIYQIMRLLDGYIHHQIAVLQHR